MIPLLTEKAVLARSRMQSVGTLRELKMQFDVDHHLRVELMPSVPVDSADRLLELVTSHLSTAQQECETDEERMQAHDAPSLVTLRYFVHLAVAVKLQQRDGYPCAPSQQTDKAPQ